MPFNNSNTHLYLSCILKVVLKIFMFPEPSFTHPKVIPNLYSFMQSVNENILKNLAVLFFLSIKWKQIGNNIVLDPIDFHYMEKKNCLSKYQHESEQMIAEYSFWILFLNLTFYSTFQSDII